MRRPVDHGPADQPQGRDHADSRHAVTEERGRGGEPGGGALGPLLVGEVGVEGAQRRRAAVASEVVAEAADQVQRVGTEGGLGPGHRHRGVTPGPPSHRRHQHAEHQQQGEQDQRRRRRHQRRKPDRDRPGEHGDGRGRDQPDEQVLQLVDVGADPGEQLAAACADERGGGERHQLLQQRDPQPPDQPQRDVVRHQPLGVAQRGP